MSLVVEVWTLVVRRDALETRLRGGIERFMELIPNPSFHADEHLAGAMFLRYEDLQDLASRLLDGSELVGWKQNTWHDMVPVDQLDGPKANDWLEVARDPEGYMYVWLKGTEPGELAAAVEWTPERSRRWVSLTPGEIRERYEPVTLWHETPAEAFAAADMEAVRDKVTGELLYTSGSGTAAVGPADDEDSPRGRR